jgi:hypothetical protein
LFYETWLRRELGGPLGASPPRGGPPALGEGIFAGTAASKGLRRELPLGEAFNERKSPFPPCSLGLSAISQQYFSLRTNQPTATSQQYYSLGTNQHQPPATSQPNRLAERNLALGEGLESGSDYLTVCWEYNMKTN